MATSKTKPTKRTKEKGEKLVKRVVAQVRILDSSEQLHDIQRRMRRYVRVFIELAKLATLPEASLRELLTKLKKRDLTLVDEIGEIRKSLDIACALLKPPD